MVVARINRSLILPSYAQGYARSAGESANPGLRDGLQGLWVPSLGPTGLALRDVSGRGNHGALINMDPAADWVTTEKGWALDFDGSNDHVMGSKPLQFADPNFLTVSVWVLTRSAIRQTIVGHNNEVGAIQLECDPPERVGVITPGVFIIRTDGLNMSEDVWHHIVYTRTGPGGGNNKLYFDGVSVTIDLDNANNFTQPSNVPELGRRAAASQQFNGQIGSVAFYDRALSLSEIQQLYRDPLAPLRMRDRVVVFGAAVASSIVVLRRRIEGY